MTVFRNGKHDDQVDSTARFLDWFKRPFPGADSRVGTRKTMIAAMVRKLLIALWRFATTGVMRG